MPLLTKGPENDLLKQTEAGIEAKLSPASRRDYQRIVLAGMKAATANNGAMLAKLPTSQDPVRDCAIGGVNVTFLMLKTMNVPPTEKLLTAATMAAYTLVMEALDMAAKMKLVEITPEVIAQATSIATDRIFAILGVTPEMFNQAAGKVNAITKDPAAMERIEMMIGSKRDPRAAVETPGLDQPEMQEGGNAPAT